jgi:hypothetical protein
MDLKQLAAEREARMRSGPTISTTAPPARARTTTGVPNGPVSLGQPSAPGLAAPAGRPFATLSSRGPAASALGKAHRSVRIAHAIALVFLFSCLLSLLLFGFGTKTLIVALLAIGLSRSGGGVLHTMLPSMLQEGQPPTPAEVEGASKGLFGPLILAKPAEAWSDECGSAVECLAFACTYGKTNCLTNSMYTGELSLGKVCSLVGGKLAEGTLRCA